MSKNKIGHVGVNAPFSAAMVKLMTDNAQRITPSSNATTGRTYFSKTPNYYVARRAAITVRLYYFCRTFKTDTSEKCK